MTTMSWLADTLVRYHRIRIGASAAAMVDVTVVSIGKPDVTRFAGSLAAGRGRMGMSGDRNCGNGADVDLRIHAKSVRTPSLSPHDRLPPAWRTRH